MSAEDEALPQVPEAELDVLSCLLHGGTLTARQIRESLTRTRPMAHASVVTLLGRLEAKGLVGKTDEKVGKAFIYRMTRRPGTVYRSLVKSLLERVFAGNGMALVHSLFETKPPSAEELDELQALLDEMKAQQLPGEVSGE